MAGSFTLSAGTSTVNSIFSEEADHIDKDIHQYTLHTSPWIDLVPKGEFESGQGYRLNTLIYGRALPQHEAAPGDGTFDQLGVNFVDIHDTALANGKTASTATLFGSHSDAHGPTYAAAQIDTTKFVKEYNLQKAVMFGPYIDLENIRFTTQLSEQVAITVDILGQATQWVLENRHRDEYDRLSDNVVTCLAATASTITTGQSGTRTSSLDPDANAAALTPTANLSNKLMDQLRTRLRRQGGGRQAWGMEDGQPIFALVASSDASYWLKTEPGIRDDIRHNAGKVDELLKPLGVSTSFRGYYHVNDDLAPRYDVTGSAPNQVFTRRQPYAYSSGVLVPNTAYETATIEVAYILHKEVMKSLFPAPNVNAGSGVSFDAQNYSGKWEWQNIKTPTGNPFGTIGRFGGQVATASKPIKVDYGYRIMYVRSGSGAALYAA